MDHWTDQLCDHHHLLRESRVRDRMLVLFEVGRLPERPHDGVACLPLIEAWRWFQNQPGTGAAIAVLEDSDGAAGARARLDALAAGHDLRVPPELFHFGPDAPARFARAGWSTVARVSDRAPGDAAAGLQGGLDLTGVAGLTTDLARRVPDIAWQGMGTAEDRDAFLGSTARFCDLPLRAGGATGIEVADRQDAALVDVEDLLGILAQVGKGVRVVLTEAGPLLPRVVRLLSQSAFPPHQTRILASADTIGREGFEALRSALPEVSLECAVDFLGPLWRVDPEQARQVVERLSQAGVDRFVLRAELADRGTLLAACAAWGVEADVRDVRRLHDLLELCATGVRSVATDFGLSRRPALRHHVDAAMGQGPPVVRLQPRRAAGRRSRARPVG